MMMPSSFPLYILAPSFCSISVLVGWFGGWIWVLFLVSFGFVVCLVWVC